MKYPFDVNDPWMLNGFMMRVFVCCGCYRTIELKTNRIAEFTDEYIEECRKFIQDVKNDGWQRFGESLFKCPECVRDSHAHPFS